TTFLAHLRYRYLHLTSRLRESVERDFQVTATVVLRWRQPTPRQVYLEGRQHQRRQRQATIALRAELDEFGLVAVLHMQIVRPLDSNGALPTGLAAVWTVIMPREEACVARQPQNPLNAAPELPSITSREIGSRCSRIGHEEGIVNEGRVPHDIGDRGEGMTRGQQYRCLHLTNCESFPICKQTIPLRPVHRDAVRQLGIAMELRRLSDLEISQPCSRSPTR